MAELCDDLAAEHADLDDIVLDLDEAGFGTQTPADGWTVRDQLSHLAHFDGAATMAAVDPGRFTDELAEALAGGDLAAIVDAPVAKGRAMSGEELLAWWRDGRAAMLEAFRPLEPSTRLPWYGPPMSAASFATARIMETWAHGQDVADGLGVLRVPTDRLRHVAHIGVRALPNSYRARGLAVPDVAVRVALASPSGERWTWGEDRATDAVIGPALDFCLVVTQRRHRDDTDLVATGPVATEWLSIAQAFAGPPGAGRSAGQFGRRG